MKTRKNKSTFTGRALAASLALFGMTASPSFAATLVHRWSFTNGSLADSVGNSPAVQIGTQVTYSDNAVTLNGTTHDTGAINLGSNLVSGDDVTIEIWGTRNQTVNNERLFDWGPSTSKYLAVPWYGNGATPEWSTIWMNGGGASYSGSVANFFYPNEEKFHIAFTIRKDGTSSIMNLVRRKVSDTSDVMRFSAHTAPNWTLSDISGSNLYLGRSQWNESDAKATYDEVRIWDGVLSDAQIAKNAEDGPDKIEMLPLERRWSFTNGSLDDGMGNSPAVQIGTQVTYSDNAVTLNGTTHDTGAINLGSNLVSGGDVTIEIWGTRDQAVTNERLFDWGPSTSKYLAVPWYGNGATPEWSTIWMNGGGASYSGSVADFFYPNGEKFHIAFTIRKDGTSSIMNLVRRKVSDTSDVMRFSAHTVANWTLSDISGSNLYLGRSQWNESDAKATYDEVRIYSRVVPDQLLALNAAMGPDTLILSFDEKGNASIAVPANTTLPVSANITIGGKVTFGEGAKIEFDTANYPDGMSFTAEGGFVVPSGDVADYVTHTASGDYVVSLQGNTLIVAPSTATSWTGEAGDGNWNNAANWTKGVPTADSEVTILSTATSMPQVTGACRSFTVAGGTLAADCDWSGLTVKPVIDGAVNLNGHNLTMPSIGITAQSGAAFSNSAATTNEVRFLANDATVAATEATYIDGVAYLTTAANAKIAIVHSSGDSSGTLNVGAANNHTAFRAESGTVSMSENGNVGMTSGGVGYLDVAGGTVDFCTANDRGISLGGANARAIVNISGGKLRANWIDAGHNDVTECTIVQTGGEVETGINNNGNLWLGRHGRGKATYTLSNGSINVTKGTLDVGNYGTATFTQDGGTVTVAASNLRVGAYGNSTGTYVMSDGSVSVTAGQLDVGADGTGVFTQDGGTVTIAASDLRVGQNSGAIGTYTLNSGTVTPKFWFLIGGSGSGTFTQNGGEAVLTGASNNNGNWVAIGRYAGGNGTYVMNDGSLEVGTGSQGGGICVGFDANGIGRFEMNGGTVTTPTIFKKNGQGTVVLNGGTIKVAKDGGEASSTQASDIGIIKNIDNLVFGNGTTIDTDGHNTSITGCGYDTVPGSSFVKTGAGTLTAAMPPVDTLIVSNGVLALSAAADNSKPLAALAHRWSFTDGSLADSEGSAPDATTIPAENPALAFENGEVVMTGDGNSTGTLNLGKGVVPAGNATIEIWATRTGVKKWSRVFDYGTGTSDYFMMSWAYGEDGTKDSVSVTINGGQGNINNTMLYEDNVKYHISATATVNADGSTTLSWAKRDVATGEVLKSDTRTFSGWTLAKLVAGNFYLGHSQFTSDLDANAKYDEVRIWRGALNDEALTLSAQKGPDATTADIAAIVAKNAETPVGRTLDLAGGTIDLGGYTLTQPNLTGNGGAVRNGTLTITDTIRLNVGDCITASGTIDLTDANVEIVDVENLSTPFWFIKPAENGTLTVVGTPEAVNLPKGWKISASSSGAKVQKVGFTIYVR